MTFLYFLWALPAKTKFTIAGLICAAVLIGYVGCLSHRARKAEEAAKAAQIEANRQAQQAEGLKIIINANTIAGEVENGKKIANQQAVNSNAAVNKFNHSVERDSNLFSGNRAAVNSRYCQRFPNDSSCR